MPAPAVSIVVREILTGDINLSADEVIKRAKARGVVGTDSSIRDTVHNIKSALKKKLASGAAPMAVPAAARATKGVAPAPVPAPSGAIAPVVAPVPDLAAVLANVALVNTVVGACGGAESARQVAEAVRACGSVEAFLQYLDLVAGIRGA